MDHVSMVAERRQLVSALLQTVFFFLRNLID